MIKILIADDHQLVIDGVKSMLAAESHLSLIGEALNGQALLDHANLAEADLVLLDIGMPVLSGLEASRALRKSHPDLKILVLTTYADHRTIKSVLKLGVHGYLLKDSGKADFLAAIAALMDDRTYYDARVTEVMMSSFQGKKSGASAATPLTEREKEIIRLIADGLSTTEIAEKLFLSALTVETHRKNIFTKLGVNKVATLVRYAVEAGLLD